jgi:hypothetical protein
LKRPQYQRIRISLERSNRILALVENSWPRISRIHSLKELENLLDRQREYIYERLDMPAAARRSLAEEVRWDVDSNKKSQDLR